MSGLAWIILNAALIIAAIGGTYAIKTRPAPAPLKIDSAVTSPDGKASSSSSISNATSPTGEKNRRTSSAHDKLDDIWSKTLFQPSREEAPDAVAGVAAIASGTANQNAEFELIGVAQLRQENKDAVPVAILRAKNSGNRRNTQMPRGGRNSSPTPSNQANPKTANGGKFAAQAPKEVFKVGDKINDTGYVVKNIDVSKHEVEIVRGSQSVKLTINFANDDAQKRREAATQQEQKLREQAKQLEANRIREAQTAANANKNMSAPMPPNTTQRQTGTQNTQTRTQQTRQNTQGTNNTSDEARQRILQQLRQRRTRTGNSNTTK